MGPRRATNDDGSAWNASGGHEPSPLRAAAVVGVTLIQAGFVGLFVTTWWRHARVVVDSPAVDSALWRVLTAVLFVWVVVVEVRALVRGRRTPLVVVSLATVAMLVALLLESLGPR